MFQTTKAYEYLKHHQQSLGVHSLDSFGMLFLDGNKLTTFSTKEWSRFVFSAVVWVLDSTAMKLLTWCPWKKFSVVWTSEGKKSWSFLPLISFLWKVLRQHLEHCVTSCDFILPSNRIMAFSSSLTLTLIRNFLTGPIFSSSCSLPSSTSHFRWWSR